MASKAPLAFTLEGVPLLTTPEVNAYVAKLNATTKDKIDRGRVMGAWSAQSMIRRRLTDFAGGTLCQHCWLSQIYCVCRSLPPVLGPAYAGSSGECTLLKNRMRVSVVLHPKEVSFG